MLEQIADDWMKDYDEDYTEELDFWELQNMLGRRAKSVFKEGHDTNKDGALDKDELYNMLAKAYGL